MKLIELVPKYYAKSRVMQEIFSAFETELEAANIKVSRVQEQFFVGSAEENIVLHEQDTGVISQGDITTRRARVLSRLRGTSTAKKEMIKNVIASFVGGEIEIKENAARYHIGIKFVGYKGTPKNLESIQVAVEEIKPAHLALVFEFTYCEHRHLLKYTHGRLGEYTHQGITRLGGVNNGE